MDTVKTDIETRRSPDEEPFKSPTEVAEYIAARYVVFPYVLPTLTKYCHIVEYITTTGWHQAGS